MVNEVYNSWLICINLSTRIWNYIYLSSRSEVYNPWQGDSSNPLFFPHQGGVVIDIDFFPNFSIWIHLLSSKCHPIIFGVSSLSCSSSTQLCLCNVPFFLGMVTRFIKKAQTVQKRCTIRRQSTQKSTQMNGANETRAKKALVKRNKKLMKVK